MRLVGRAQRDRVGSISSLGHKTKHGRSQRRPGRRSGMRSENSAAAFADLRQSSICWRQSQAVLVTTTRNARTACSAIGRRLQKRPLCQAGRPAPVRSASGLTLHQEASRTAIQTEALRGPIIPTDQSACRKPNGFAANSLELCRRTGAQRRSERSRTPCQAIDSSGVVVCWRREGDSNPR